MERPKLLSLCLFLFLTMIPGLSRSQAIDWRSGYDEAKGEAYFKNKFILLFFTGNWNPAIGQTDDPRMRMDSDIWRDTSVIPLSKKFICVELFTDAFPRISLTPFLRYNQLMVRHKIYDLPTTVIIDPLGAEYARIVGFTSLGEVRKIMEIPIPNLYETYQILHSLEEKPDDVGLTIAAGDAYAKINLPGLSNHYYEMVIDADSLKTDPALREHVHTARAVNYSVMNNMHESIAIFKELLDEYPASANRPTYLLWLTRLHVQASKLNAAREYLNVLRKEFPASEQTRSAEAFFK